MCVLTGSDAPHRDATSRLLHRKGNTGDPDGWPPDMRLDAVDANAVPQRLAPPTLRETLRESMPMFRAASAHWGGRGARSPERETVRTVTRTSPARCDTCTPSACG